MCLFARESVKRTFDETLVFRRKNKKMEEKSDEIASEERLKNQLFQAENPAFKIDEMIACGKCARANPPTRRACLYCGAELEIPDAQSRLLKLKPRALEAWEKGFNVIFSPVSEDFEQSEIEKAAAFLRLETEVLQNILASEKPLPLTRVATEKEAEIVKKILSETARIETKIISDADLDAEKPPRRLRGMKFFDDNLILILFNDEEAIEIARTNVDLIVTGAIFERRIAGVEARGKRGGESKILETNETASDEILIDVYSRDDKTGFRVEQKGFDFSCLGAEKNLLVAENMRALVRQLSNRAPDAKIVEDYLRVRRALAAVWAVQERTEARGLKRARFGAFSRENLTTISNRQQFTKYSRLQRQIL